MRQLKSIKRKQSTGLHNIPPGLLNNSAEQISTPLTYLINFSLTTGVFPTEWKAAKVMPIQGSGPFSNFDNYLPTSILPVLSKLLKRLYIAKSCHSSTKTTYFRSPNIASGLIFPHSTQQLSYWMILEKMFIKLIWWSCIREPQ